jgi:hypothetical protein
MRSLSSSLTERPYCAPCFLAVLLATVLLCSCGSGSGSGNPAPPPPPDFSLAASPISIQLAPGSSQNLSISINALNGFTGQANVSVTGALPGVTATPASFALSAGSPQQVVLAAQNSALAATVSLMVKAVSGTLSHSVQVALSVQTATSSMHAPLRTQYQRTDSFYSDGLQYAPPHFTAYDQPLRRFFVSNPYLNRIDVFDAAQEFQIGSIPVPFVWGIDTSPDGTKLYAGTLIGDVYQIDPAALQVTQRFPSATLGPTGYSASSAFVLADGRLALLGPLGGFPLDGESGFAIWDPVSNSLEPEAFRACGDVIGNTGAFALSGDRTMVLLASIDSDGTVCSYNPNTQQGVTGDFGSFLSQIEPTPDGKSFFVTDKGGGIVEFDVVTMQQLQQTTTMNFIYGAALSMDGSTLYVADSFGLIEAYATSNLSMKGWVPNYTVFDATPSIVPAVVDETGLIVGPIGHGVAFVDSTLFQPGALPNQVSLIEPAPGTGPLAGGSQIQIGASGDSQASFPGLSQAYLGNSILVGAKEVSGQGLFPSIVGSSPASAVGGAADSTQIFQNLTIGILPEGFSYGPTIVELSSNGSSAEGGSNGTLIGYGLGQTTSDVQVTVGGQAAPVTSVGYEGTPFPTQGLVFTVPPGTPGSSVDVTVTTANGSVTASGAFHYVAATKFYPLTATLQQGVYDSNRNVYYFTDQTKIQVFSLTTGQWLSPITLPNVTAQTQFVGLSLLPDGSKMAVADFGDETIYVLDPTQPNSAQEFPVLPDDEGIASPCGLAIAANGLVYYASADINGTGANAFHVLDTATGVTMDIPEIVNGGLSDEFDRVFLSPDGTRAYSNAGGSPFWMDTGTDLATYPSLSLLGPGSPDFAMSADSTTFAADGYLTDAYLNPFSMVAYIDRELFFPTAVYGQKLSKDGALLFQPLTDGIDVLDSQSGRLLYRIQLPIQISNTYDALVSDGKDDTLVAITNGGIASIDLSSLPLPQTRHDKTDFASHRALGTTRSQTKPMQKGIPRSNAPRLHYRDDYRAARQSQLWLP